MILGTFLSLVLSRLFQSLILFSALSSPYRFDVLKLCRSSHNFISSIKQSSNYQLLAEARQILNFSYFFMALIVLRRITMLSL